MRYLMFLLGLMFANMAQAMDCEKVPDCESLGYSTESDPNCADNGYMFCPFDHEYKKCVQYNCEQLGFTQNDKTSWCKNIVTCRGNPEYTLCVKAICQIGDVYYADGSCGLPEDYNGSKTPVGIVYYVEEEGYHGRVMALNGLTGDENHNFDPKNPFHNTSDPLVQGFKEYDVPEIENIPNEINKLSSRLNGKEETKILAQTVWPDCPYEKGTSNYQWYCVGTQARATLAFYPPNTDAKNPYVGAGQWYQPAIGELLLLTENDAWNIVLKTVDNLKAAGVDVSYPCDIDTQKTYKHCTSTTDSIYNGYLNTSYEFLPETSYKICSSCNRDTGGEIRPILAF